MPGKPAAPGEERLPSRTFFRGAGPPGRMFAVRLFAVALAYFIAGKVGLAIPFTSGNVSPIWPASGVALAGLVVFGPSLWPGIAAAAFLVNFFSSLSPLAAVGLAAGNTLAALAGAALLRRVPGFQPSLSRLTDVLSLIALAAAGASAISASAGTLTFGLLGLRPWDSLGPTWVIYYLGDAMGVIALAPLLLSLDQWRSLCTGRRLRELACLLTLLVVACALLFDERFHLAARYTVLALLVFPFVLWAAIRFRIPGVSAGSLLVGLVAVLETAAGSGPFSKSTPFTNALLFQFFFATVSVSGLLLAAVITERETANRDREKLIREQAAQEAVRAAEERYRLIVETANEGICTLDSSLRTAFANLQFARMLGYEPGAILGTDARLFWPDIPASLPEAAHVSESRFRRRDGGTFWGAVSAAPIPDGLHGSQGMLVLLTDITERKRAEEYALESSRELQAVLDNSPALIYLKDTAGRYQYVNRCWSESFHASLDEVRGKTDFELFPEAAAARFVANDRQVAASVRPLEFEEQAEFEGQLRSYRSTKVALRESTGEFYALCGISTDITDRKAEEEALRQVHRALRVLSSCTSAVALATGEQELLEQVCRVAVGPAGYSLAWIGYADHDELRTVRPVASAGQAEGFLDRIHVSWAEDRHGRGSMGTAIRELRPVVCHRIREHPDFAVWKEALENRSFQSVLAVPLRLGDTILGAFAIYADEPEAFDADEVNLIVELGDNVAHGIASLRAHRERAEALAALERARLELEDRVRQRTAELVVAKEAAESADHLKSAFLATMSHELRTPLNSILGFTGVILQGLAGPLNAEQAKQLGMVQNSARHLLALINDVLDISKIEAGRLEIACEWFSLPQIVRKAVATVLPLAEAKGVRVSTAIEPDVDRIYTDRRRTEQIVLNLLSNAVKFTDRGEIAVSCRRDRDRLEIAVADTGIGIDAPHLEDIFKPFRQADSSLARKHEGTGLGLSISKRLVERLHGSISVKSAPGEGSTFTVVLPVELERSCEHECPGDRRQ